MQIQIASDLHLEHLSNDEALDIIKKLRLSSSAEIMILAGDICAYNQIIAVLNAFALYYSHVVYVNGNHEAWYSSLNELKELKKSINNEKIHWLSNERINIDGQNFVGSTLWFSENPIHQIYEKYWRSWPDFKRINGGKLSIYKENKISKDYLENNISENDIVITHHFPSPKSIHSKYEHDECNSFFLCDMEDVILNKNPKYWIHGHSHEKFDYIIGNTRIIANPLGYSGEIDIGEFNWSKVIEI